MERARPAQFSNKFATIFAWWWGTRNQFWLVVKPDAERWCRVQVREEASSDEQMCLQSRAAREGWYEMMFLREHHETVLRRGMKVGRRMRFPN